MADKAITELRPDKWLRQHATEAACPKISIIIPAYNEQSGLAVVLDKLSDIIDDSYEVLVVDDGSTDDTRQVALRYPCRVITHGVNQGKGAAVRTGIRAARGEGVVIIDADDSYPVEEVPRIAHSLATFDMAVASRARGRNNVPPFHRLGNALFRGLIRRLYGFRPRDPLTGFYAIRKEHLVRMHLESTDFGIESEIAIKGARMGLRMADIPIEYRPRIGQAKLHGLKDGYRILAKVFKMLALYNPTAMFVVPGGMLFALGVVLLFLLMGRPLSIGRVTLEAHTVIAATMLALAGFQIGVFGFSLNLYGLAHRFTRPDAVTRLFLRNYMARNIGVLGLLILGAALSLAARLANEWARASFGTFTATKQLALTLFLAVFALQMLFSAVFLSIFAAELRRREQVVEADLGQGQVPEEAVGARDER